MEKILTGGIVQIITGYLFDCEVIRFFQISTSAYKFFNDEQFWLHRFVSMYGTDEVDSKPEEISWKTYYLSISKCTREGKDVNDFMVNAIRRQYDYCIPFFISLGA